MRTLEKWLRWISTAFADRLLPVGRFYRWIADSEQHQLEVTRQEFDALHD